MEQLFAQILASQAGLDAGVPGLPISPLLSGLSGAASASGPSESAQDVFSSPFQSSPFAVGTGANASATTSQSPAAADDAPQQPAARAPGSPESLVLWLTLAATIVTLVATFKRR